MIRSKFTYFLATLVFFITTACTSNGEKDKYTELSDIKEDAQEYDGKTVEVYGEVDDKTGEYSFELEQDGTLSETEITVLTEKTLQQTAPELVFDEGMKVAIRGRISNVSIIDLDRTYGWGLEPTVIAELEKVKPFLIAETITVKKRDE